MSYTQYCAVSLLAYWHSDFPQKIIALHLKKGSKCKNVTNPSMQTFSLTVDQKDLSRCFGKILISKKQYAYKKDCKSPGCDQISIELIKHAPAPIISNIIVHLHTKLSESEDCIKTSTKTKRPTIKLQTIYFNFSTL